MGDIRRFVPRDAHVFRSDGAVALQEYERKPTMHIVRLRNLPLSEPPIVFTEYYERITELRRQWDTELAQAGIIQSSKKKNYDPVLPRVKFELLTTEQEKEEFKNAEKQNVITSIRERLHTQESRFKIMIDQDGKLRNVDFPDEPLEDIYKRGVETRKREGSTDTKREQEEFDGFLKMQALLTDQTTPLGTAVIVISGKSSQKDTPYTDNFVDVQEVLEDEQTGERYILYTRFASPLTYEEYQKIALTLDPKYFVGYDTETCPIDAWYLGHPFIMSTAASLGNTDRIFEQYFHKDTAAMEEKIFQEVIEHGEVQEHIAYHLDGLLSATFSPITIAERWHALLVAVEKQFTAVKCKKQSPEYSRVHQNAVIYTDIEARVKQYKKEAVKEVGAGCGSSSGFSFGGKTDGTSSTNSFFDNSVAQFGKESNNLGTCDICGQSAADNHYHCPKEECKQKYSDETNKRPEDRTKQCGCGFKFKC